MITIKKKKTKTLLWSLKTKFILQGVLHWRRNNEHMDTLELISRTLHILFCLILLTNYHVVRKQYFLLQNFGKKVVNYEKCEQRLSWWHEAFSVKFGIEINFPNRMEKSCCKINKKCNDIMVKDLGPEEHSRWVFVSCLAYIWTGIV